MLKKMQNPMFQKVMTLATLAVLTGAFQTVSAYAEETANPIPESKPAQWREHKKERMEKFFENHLKAKERFDANQDGTVDKTEFQQVSQERRENKREKFFENHPEAKERLDTNQDGTVDKTEFRQGHKNRQDKDNNPPGPKGGPGTNWENRPGPQGGPGASPDRRSGGEHRGGGPRKNG